MRTNHFLKFSSLFLILTAIIFGIVFYAIDIYYLNHGNYEKWGGKNELFYISVQFHFVTAFVFSIGSFLSIFTFRNWLSTIEIKHLMLLELLPAILLLIIIMIFRDFFWGSVGDSLFSTISSGIITRVIVGYLGSSCIFLIIKYIVGMGQERGPL